MNYFSHDYGARNDAKLQEVLFNMGYEGIGIYWSFVEVLYENDGYLPESKIGVIAFSLKVDEDKLRHLIYDFNLFNIDGERHNIFSGGAIKRLKIREEKSKINSINGKKGADKKWGKLLDSIDNTPHGERHSETMALKNKNKSKSIYKGNFKKPKIEDIIQYCNERNNGVNPERFFDFYEAKDWMIGKNKMKDWKAAVRTWEQQDKVKNKSSNNDELKRAVKHQLEVEMLKVGDERDEGYIKKLKEELEVL